MNRYTLRALVNEHCDTGENPYWDRKTGLVYWTDIPRGKVFRYNPQTAQHAVIYEGDPVGGFTMQANGRLLLFRVNDFSELQPDGTVKLLRHFHEEGVPRFNDVIADPEGRVFAGTMGATKESGGLYLVQRDGTVERLFSGTGCSNGMAFTADLKTFYWTCSTRKKIFQFDYDQATGAIQNERLFYHATDPAEGTPDGLTIDQMGNIWSARWGGSGIYKISPQGKVLDKIEFPVKRVSSVTYGGLELDRFYVTTAAGKNPETEADGTLYEVTGDLGCGLPEFESRILID